MLCRGSGCSLRRGDGSAQGYILMEMPCLAAPLAKLITFMDYRLKGNISLTVTLCNAISLTTHLILGCNSPPRTITNKVVSWDSEQEKERRATEQISHLSLSTQRNEKAGGGGGAQEPGSALSTPGRWGTGDLGYTKTGKEDLGKILLLLQGWDFGLQQDPILCQTERKELGNPWGILCYTNALSQHKECPQLVTGLQLG